MIEIIFQGEQDARDLFAHIHSSMPLADDGGEWVQLDIGRRKVKICTEFMTDSALLSAREGVYHFIAVKKREDWVREILSERFFYQDCHEQEHIIQIMDSIMSGAREGLPSFVGGLIGNATLKPVIDELFAGPICFSFDSFVTFRLKAFFDQLNNCAEVAIDEYKLEQDYQVFIQTLRDFLAARGAQREAIHLVIDERPLFFDEHANEITRSELMRSIDRKLLGNHPVYVDSATIAPLLSIAPAVIYLYTDHPEQPLIRTICNIFEERVKLERTHSFQKNNGQNA